MIKLIVECVISISFIAFGLFIALHIYFKRLNPEALSSINKIDKETKRKLKAICKMEHRQLSDQIALIIEMFIDAYTEKHGINWDEILY